MLPSGFSLYKGSNSHVSLFPQEGTGSLQVHQSHCSPKSRQEIPDKLELTKWFKHQNRKDFKISNLSLGQMINLLHTSNWHRTSYSLQAAKQNNPEFGNC